VVQKAIEDRGGQDFVAEDGAPLGDELIGGDQQAATLIATRHELKEEMGAAACEGEVPELVDDEQLRFAEKHQPIGELPLGLGLGQRREQRRGAGKEHRVSRFDDGTAECNRQMGLPDAGAPKIRTLSAWPRKRPVASSRTRR
jgi:hypothetical protein